MQCKPFSTTESSSTGRPLHCKWALIAVVSLTMLFNLSSSQVAFAQNSSCGEPERSQTIEGQAEPTLNRTFKLDQCVIRNFDYAGQPKKIVVYYTTTNGIASDHLLAVDTNGDAVTDLNPNQIADQVAQWTETAWRTYRDYGLADPYALTTFRVHLFDSKPGLLGWCCTADSYEIDAPAVRGALTSGGDVRNGEYITYHEMWHAMESSPKLGGWVTEGSAAFMSDHVTLPVDVDNDGDYLGRVSEYMGSTHATSLTSQEYAAAPWWTYFTEQFTAINAEPSRGADIMKEYLFHPAVTAFARIDAIIRSHDPNRRLESVWMDFAVSNYAKDLTGAVPVNALYRYQDELQANAPQYSTVQLTLDTAISPGSGAGPQQSDIQPWASKYYKFDIAATVPIINLEFRQDSNHHLGYVLMKIRNGDLVETTYSITRDFVQSFANSNYSSIVVAVVSFAENANFRYTLNATEPVLRILDPLESRPVQAGAPAAPDKILVKVEVLNPAGGGTPIAGIDPKTFTVAVGAKIVPAADIISGAYIQGQYWLLLRAPSQDAVGDYALTVAFGTLNDAEVRAVHYEAVKNADNVLVIDRSGSMAENGGGKMVAAKDAARLYVDSWRNGDQVGVVSFNEDATVNLSLNDWQLARGAALTAINGLVPGGDTSIGDGAIAGMNELATKGIAGSHDWALIVLSDGIENRMEFIPKFLESYNARVAAKQQAPKVHTIALGADADRARLEDLAAKAGGTYFLASIPEVAVAASIGSTMNPAAIHSAYLSNDLAEIYRVASEQVSHNQQVYLNTSVLDYDNTPVTHTITIEGAVNEATFVLKWNANGLGSNVTLRQPDGTDVGAATTSDSLHFVWRIPAPQAGKWTLAIDFELNCDPCASEVLVEASVLSDLTFDVFLAVPVEKRVVGRFMPIYATLSDSLVIGNANVVASITTPSNAIYGVTLHDDGLHNDGVANDGFYGGIFYQTWEFGGYQVAVQASGISPRTGAFVRRLRTDFNMLEFRTWDAALYPTANPNRPLDRLNPDDPHWELVDRDRDGLIDWYEIEFNLDPELVNANGSDDPDYDGLTTGDEFIHGTDPTTSDSEKGGQNDGSEVAMGSNPLDPADDATPCPFSFYVTQSVHSHENPDEPAHVDGNVLYYDMNADHTSFHIWRTKNNEAREFYVPDAPATGIYSDTNVTVSDTYRYWLSANDAEGHASCILGPVTITARADAVAPEGWVQINNGTQSTADADVSLALEATAGTTEMQVRNTPADFEPDSGWVTYATTLLWQLVSDGGYGQVFVWYRDAAGNVSELAFDAIELETPTDTTPPEGSVVINGGAASTVDMNVTLTLAATGAATEMQVRNNLADFDAAQGWTAYTTTLPWQLVANGSRGDVYAWYRDAAGNVSQPATDDIAIGTNPGGNSGLYLPKVKR